MKIIHSPRDLNTGGRPVSIAIGLFDGVHLGHQQVIRQAVADAAQQEGISVALTFDRHPKAIVAPDRVPQIIYSLPQRFRAIASLGTHATWLVRFDETFSRKPADEFVREITLGFGNVYSICVGGNFSFGYRRSGNVALLTTLGEQLGFLVHGLASVALDGQPVSSTRIREAIHNGQLDLATQMLGRPYSYAAPVLRGDRLGQQLGFPTANLETLGRAVPPTGVYAAHAKANGKTYRAVVNVGYRPTVHLPTPQLRLEAHLLDFTGELEGQEVELTFVKKLRQEQKFPSLEALRVQISQDILAAQQLFGAGPKAL